MTETADILNKPPNPWMPEKDPLILAILGKLGEESAELSKTIFRIVVQGLHECDPVTQKPNAKALEEEMADVKALLYAAETLLHPHIDERALHTRRDKKLAYALAWFKKVKELSKATWAMHLEW